MLDDLRHGARALARTPGFTAAAVATVAIGIAAPTTILSLANALLLRPLPGVTGQDRLVNVHRKLDAGGELERLSYPSYREIRDAGSAGGVLSGVAAFTDQGFVVNAGGESRLVLGQLVSGNYFPVLGVEPALGRFFRPEEDGAPGAHPVAVVSHGLWRRRLGGDPAAVGRELRLNGHPFTVVGVAPPGFVGTFNGFPFEVWVPLAMAGEAAPGFDLASPDERRLELVARLSPGATLARAHAEAAALGRRLARDRPDEWRASALDVQATKGTEDSLYSGLLLLLSALGSVALLLLAIACVNVGGMLLARGTARGREVAVRLAIGAGRGRLVRQLLTETLLLFLPGGAAGILLAFWTTDLLRRFDPPVPVPLAFDLAPDGRVLASALALAALAGLAFGLVPALAASRPDLVAALRGGGTGRRGSRLRGAFVAGQVAMALLLLVTAGLFLRTLGAAAAADPGFAPAGLYLTDVDVSLLERDPARGWAIFERLVARAEALPGVEAATVAERMPLGLGRRTAEVALPGREPAPGEPGLTVEWNAVGRRYFEALRIPVLAGRGFGAADRAGAPPVAMVNETLARRLWPGQGALGRRLVVRQDRRGALPEALPEAREVEVVGVARDGRYRSLWEEPRPALYLPAAQARAPRMFLLLRAQSPAALAALPGEMRTVEEDLPVARVVPAAEYVGISLLPQRLAAAVAGALGAVGLLLAAIGLYAVMAFAVAQRTREIGVRMALGASRGEVARLVLRGGARLAGAGLLAGAAAALAATRLLAGLLHGVGTADPAAFAGGAALLLAVALAASWLPARRAARLDPAACLRRD